MDTQNLLTHLSNTLSSDNKLRKESEAFLLGHNAHIVAQILDLLVCNNTPENAISPQLQLVCLTLIKNRLASDWNAASSDESLKASIKTQIVQYVVKFTDPFSANHHALIRMSLKIIDTILSYSTIDFQYDLLNFADDLMGKEDKTIANFYTSVLLIRQVARRNRHLDNHDLVNNISLKFCPLYYEFLDAYNGELQGNNVQSKKNIICYEILKTLNYITSTRISKFLQNPENLKSYCTVLNQLFYLFLTQCSDYRNCKWILRFMIKLQIRSTQIVDNSIYAPEFVAALQNSILQYNISSLMELTTKSEEFLSSFVAVHREDDDSSVKVRTLYYFLTYLTKCISPMTYQCIEPYMNIIISNVIIKVLSIDNEEIDNFESDPVEFINNNLSSSFSLSNGLTAFAEISTPDLNSAGSSFLYKLTKNKPEMISPLASLAGQLSASNDKSSVACALKILTLIQSHIESNNFDSILSNILGINANLDSEGLWLRCLIYDFFSKIDKDIIDSTNLPITLEPSQPLPLLISSVKFIILKSKTNKYDAVQLMQVLLSISESENLEIVNDLIDILVEKYPQQLGPYSFELINNLANSFSLILEDKNSENTNDDGSKENKLLGIINNIITIIMSSTDKSMVANINNALGSLIGTVLDNALLDFVEPILELTDEINLKCEKVLNLDIVVNSFRNYGFDYFEYYESYFQSCYCYGDLEQRSKVTDLLRWILTENPSGFESDDEEFIEFLSNLGADMVISCNPEENDNNLSNEVFSQILQMMYNSFEDKETFWESKSTFRCVLGGLFRKPMIVMNMFGNNIEEILIRFESLIKNNVWCTVYDLKLGMLALLEVVNGSSDNEHLRNLAMNLLSMLCDRVNGAIEHRDKLIKYSFDESKENELDSDEVANFIADDEFDELNKKSVIDRIDVFGNLKALLSSTAA